MTWETLDEPALERLRSAFLAERPGQPCPWRSATDLACYDFTFGQRIGWKWDAVLRELRRLNWELPAGAVLDWGCGSGIAGRRVVEFASAAAVTALRLSDRSPLAVEFATAAAVRAFPGLRVEPAGDDRGSGGKAPATLVVSHVLGELDDAARQRLLDIASAAEAVLWVEPGTHSASRRLVEVREELRDRFRTVAPCPHDGPCGLLSPGNERHWCHHFAPPPAAAMGDSAWVRFAQRAGIDLRRLPYSHLVLERRRARETPPGAARVLGEPRFYKGYAQILSCEANGVRERTLQKRDAPGFFLSLRGGREGTLFRWALRGDRIAGAERVAGSGERPVTERR